VLKNTLQQIAATLEKLHVPYALIGGLAVIVRGIVRATKDIDFLLDLPVQQGPALAQSLNENGLPATFRKGGPDDPIVGAIRVTIPTAEDPIHCDILFPSKLWQAEAVRNAAPVYLEGIAIPVVITEDLFLLKLFAGGPQDLLDAAQLFKLQSHDQQRAWKERAGKIGRSRAFARCLKFLPDEH
jgi:hypothetical protein